MSQIIPSSVVILLKKSRTATSGIELLLLRRNRELSTHGGSWVFPGGKVDPSDLPPARRLGDKSVSEQMTDCSDDEQLHVTQKAALRELQEEAGITLAMNDLHFHSRWLTPDSMKKRFDAFFFAGVSPTECVQIDGQEIHDFVWIDPAGALLKHQAGEWVFPPSTFVTLSRLLAYSSPEDVIQNLAKDVFYFKPRLVPFGGGLASLYQDDAGYETRDPNAAGRQHRLIMVDGHFEYIP